MRKAAKTGGLCRHFFGQKIVDMMGPPNGGSGAFFGLDQVIVADHGKCPALVIAGFRVATRGRSSNHPARRRSRPPFSSTTAHRPADHDVQGLLVVDIPEPAAARGDDDIEQRQGFGGEHIERSPGKRARVQRVQYCRLIDAAPARDIDERRSGLQCRQHLGVDDEVRVRVARRQNHDKIRLGSWRQPLRRAAPAPATRPSASSICCRIVPV